MALRTLLRSLGHQRAVANARAASREASRRRVQREEVELYLERLHGSRQPARLDASRRWVGGSHGSLVRAVPAAGDAAPVSSQAPAEATSSLGGGGR